MIGGRNLTAWIAALWAMPLFAAPPKVDQLFPAGGQRGQTVVVTATGDLSTWPAQLWSSQSGITATAEQDKGKFRVTIPAEATPGIVWLRAYNAEGAAAAKPFVIGTLPEVEEVEPNDTPAKPQNVAEKVVVNGRLAKSGDVDGYTIALKQGQTLVASLQANHGLGSPLDGVLQICELAERRGRPEAFVAAQNHDAVGLDPQLAFTAPRDGNYLVRVFAFPAEGDASISFAGKDNFLYRLTVTTGGFADYALPLAIRRGQAAETKLFGWNLPAEGSPVSTPPAGDPLLSQVFAFHADAAGVIPLAVVDYNSLAESQANQLLEVPIAVSGQLGKEREVDSFTFLAKKGGKLRIECESRSLGYAIRTRLRVTDEAGKSLAAAEQTQQRKDTDLVFTPPADGKYVVSVADEHGRGGPRFVYRLSIEAAGPEFDPQLLAGDSFVIAADKPAEVSITLAIRGNKLEDALEFKAIDLPAGISCEPLKVEKPQNGQVVKLVLKAAPEAAATSAPIRIVGVAGPTTRLARISAGASEYCWLTVKK
jgi:hypothetical protein